MTDQRVRKAHHAPSRASGTAVPRVLLVLDTFAGWSRGILQGFTRVAHEQGWTVLHYHPGVDLGWLNSEWSAQATVVGPAVGSWPAELRSSVAVAANADLSEEAVSSVCPDEAGVAELALSHLLARGIRTLTTFRFDDSRFGELREQHFRQAALRAGARLELPWWDEAASPSRKEERSQAILQWLLKLEKPCGIFTCCDSWGRVAARYAHAAGLRIPEDVSLVGVDNDTIECELMTPPLSSVAIPWHKMGETAAELVRLGLQGERLDGKRLLIAPTEVVTRRSSDPHAIADPLVAAAVAWIHDNAHRRLSVTMIATAMKSTRQRLERHFRRTLGRTVMNEVRRAHVELARTLLCTTDLALPEVAQRSGFTNPALLSVAFNRELGMPPGVFRRRARMRSAPS